MKDVKNLVRLVGIGVGVGVLVGAGMVWRMARKGKRLPTETGLAVVVPDYPGAGAKERNQLDGVVTTVFTTQDQVDRVLGFYRDRMTRQGWSVIKNDYRPAARAAQMVLALGSRECAVRVFSSGKGTAYVVVSSAE